MGDKKNNCQLLLIFSRQLSRAINKYLNRFSDCEPQVAYFLKLGDSEDGKIQTSEIRQQK